MSSETDHNQDPKSLPAEIRLYVEKRIQLFSLTLAEQLSLVVAQSIQRMIGILLLSGALFFLWFAFGFYLGELLESPALGFMLASVPLFIAGFIFINQKSKKLTHRIQADLIEKAMKSVEDSLKSNKKREAESEEK